MYVIIINYCFVIGAFFLGGGGCIVLPSVRERERW